MVFNKRKGNHQYIGKSAQSDVRKREAQHLNFGKLLPLADSSIQGHILTARDKGGKVYKKTCACVKRLVDNPRLNKLLYIDTPEMQILETIEENHDEFDTILADKEIQWYQKRKTELGQMGGSVVNGLVLTNKKEIPSLPKYLFIIDDERMVVGFKSNKHIIDADSDNKYELEDINGIKQKYSVDDISGLLDRISTSVVA